MAIHHKAPEQHYTTLMAHSGLPYDINPPPHSTDFICKVVGGDKLFFFVFFFPQGANGRGRCDADTSTHTHTNTNRHPCTHTHTVYMPCCSPWSAAHTHTHIHRDIKNRSADAHTFSTVLLLQPLNLPLQAIIWSNYDGLHTSPNYLSEEAKTERSFSFQAEKEREHQDNNN